MAYNCSNCREPLRTDDDLTKVSIGQGRNVIFCKECNCYVTIEEPAKAKKVAKATTPQTSQQPPQ